MNFRKLQEKDFNDVRNILKSSWHEAYSTFIPQDDLDFFIDKTYSEIELKKIFDNPDYICFVSESKEKVCGWLKLNINKSENRFYLSSIYVLPEFQKNKIGERFYEITCNEAVKNGFNEIYIGVMIQNERALNWYKKLGFIFYKEDPFTMGKTSVIHLIGKKVLYS
jgi:ribosomal protein S18 acetylase RimI-like enzyme